MAIPGCGVGAGVAEASGVAVGTGVAVGAAVGAAVTSGVGVGAAGSPPARPAAITPMPRLANKVTAKPPAISLYKGSRVTALPEKKRSVFAMISPFIIRT